MDWTTIINAIIVILSTLLTTGIPAIIAFINAVKARKIAETEADKEKANADLLATAKDLIASAEVMFDGFDKMMKSQGSSAGTLKKDNVMAKLQAYASQKGYEFDTAEWSENIDNLVAFTKSVNAKDN